MSRGQHGERLYAERRTSVERGGVSVFNLSKNVRFQWVGALVASTAAISSAHAEDRNLDRRHAVGTSLFMFANFLPEPESPDFVFLEYGYAFTADDIVLLQVLTWKYGEPLGFPLEGRMDYPGIVRSVGGGLAYQRFVWGNFYLKGEATNFFVRYLDEERRLIQSGYQLYVQLRPGYHWAFQLLETHFYLEPSVSFIAWPINTNRPRAFARAEDRYTPFFLFEPGLNFGVEF
jgi:hypothetical protein